MRIHPPYPEYKFFRRSVDLFSPSFAIDASILAYSEEKFIREQAKKVCYELIFIGKPLFQCLVFTGPVSRDVLVAFRGTMGPKDWEVDLEIEQNALGFHKGFYDAANSFAQDLYPLVNGQNVLFTGHSLGAAMAAIAAHELQPLRKSVSILNFGQPRIGNYQAVGLLQKIPWVRYVHASDIVHTVPFECFDYAHGGHEIILPQVPHHWWHYFSREWPCIIPVPFWAHVPTLYAKRIWGINCEP